MRTLVLHMIEEYARHNGHADLLRECHRRHAPATDPQRAGSEAPVTIQRPPSQRGTSVSSRASRNASNAHHSATSPPSAASTSRASGTNASQRHHAGPREVPAVAGPDQHAVEGEDDAADRLGHRGHDQHVGEQRPHRRVRR